MGRNVIYAPSLATTRSARRNGILQESFPCQERREEPKSMSAEGVRDPNGRNCMHLQKYPPRLSSFYDRDPQKGSPAEEEGRG